jgi:TonB family protein
MKVIRLALLTVFTLGCALAVYGQDAHVRTEYKSDINKTIVQTDWLYLLNTQQQFMQLLLNATYKGERLQNPPSKADLVIWSFSRAALYRESSARKLILKTDGESWSIAAQSFIAFKGETKNGQDIFWEEKRPRVGQPGFLPGTAQLKDADGINGIVMEQLFFELKPEQLLKIANANSVEMQLGETKLALTANQLSTARSFLGQINPSFQNSINKTESAPPVDNTQSPPTAVFDAGVVNGKALSLPQPSYPGTARAARAAGTVSVYVTIDEAGKVVAARAISGHPLLLKSSEDAALKARFTPTVIAGRTVKVTGVIVYHFLPREY